MDKILIQGLSIETLIGVYDWEREAKQTLFADLDIGVDLHQAAKSDDVADTVDYAELAELVCDVAAASTFELLEALADAIILAIMAKYRVNNVRIRITKPGILPNAQNVMVELYRES